MRLRTLAFLLALAAAIPAFANEFGDHCANGLANYKVLVATDCSINWTDQNSGKTYCGDAGCYKDCAADGFVCAGSYCYHECVNDGDCSSWETCTFDSADDFRGRCTG